MSFLYPSFFWALLALSVPLIIHLFNFKRYKTVYFSNNRFLQAIQKKSQSFNQLKHWLILLTRLIAISLLVFAFTQPFIPSDENQEETNSHASIYVDNSLSMKSLGVNGSLIDEARSAAVEIVKSLPRSFKIQIISNDLSSKQQRYYTPNEAIRLIDEIQASNAYRSVEEIESRINSAWDQLELKEGSKLQLFVLSDFQKSQFQNFEVFENDNWAIKFMRFEVANTGSNLAVDSAWFEQPVLQPGFDQNLKVIVRNYGDQSMQQISLKLSVNNQLLGAQEFDISAQEKKELTFSIRPKSNGDFAGLLELEAGEPFFDNKFHLSYRVDDPIKTLVIGEGNTKIFSSLYRDSIYDLDFASLNSLNYGELEQYQLLILNSLIDFPSGLETAITNKLKDGGNVILLPNFKAFENNNSFLQNIGAKAFRAKASIPLNVDKVAWNDQLFDNVFNDQPKRAQLPKIKQYFTGAQAGFELLKLENGQSILSRIPKYNGQLLVFHSDLNEDAGNLSKHPIIVPIMLNAALYSNPKRTLYNSAGRNSGQQFSKVDKSSDIPVSLLVEGQELIPQQKNNGSRTEIFNLPVEINPGIYPVVENGAQIGQIAVNIDSRESNWSFWKQSDMQDKLIQTGTKVLNVDQVNVASLVSKAYNGYPLWQWFLTGALLFLLIEMILLKLWK